MKMETETGLQITVTKIPYKINAGLVKKIIFVVVMILMCVLLLPVISSQMTVYVSYDSIMIELDEYINLINGFYDEMNHNDGVSIKTECNIYSPDTTRIMIEWENSTDEELMMSKNWDLFKKQGTEFVPMPRLSWDCYWLESVDYPIGAGQTRMYGYLPECFADKLSPGIYKIKTFYYSYKPNPKSSSAYFSEAFNSCVVETEFEVSGDKSKWDTSAYNFLNGENYGKFTDITIFDFGTFNSPNSYSYSDNAFRLYKNKETHEMILTDGTYEYEIGKSSDKVSGINSIIYYETAEQVFFIYPCLRDDETGEWNLYICVLDITDNSNVKEVYRSDPLSASIAVMLDWEAGKINISAGKIEEYGDNGWYFTAEPHVIGWFSYKNGEFFYERNPVLK
ncbi:MAG: hypothetical protein FWF92_11155 [Oscillospiraceae bacterium]|nr:hypothetical protein [Oscillospiraceae bacterium]